MKEIKLGFRNKIKLYDSCKEMPITRYHELQKLAMIDMGIGSTVEDFNGHFSKLHAYIANDKKEDSINEMKNVFKNFYLMIDRVGVWSYSMLCFIHSINNKEYELSEDRYKEDILLLSKKGLTVKHCEDQINELKKKIHNELESYFPTRYNGTTNANIISDVKRQSIKILESIIADYKGDLEAKKKADKVIASIDDYIVSLNPPKDFSDTADSCIIHLEKSFEYLCTSMEEVGISSPKKLSVYEFNSKIDYFKSKNKSAK